jgi:two-component system, cell cycle sensor histidine kinase and response regulator CckA
LLKRLPMQASPGPDRAAYKIGDAFEVSLGAARIATIYILVGTLWILLSDVILAAIIQETRTLSIIQSIKGFAFVAVTGLVLFLLVRRDSEVLRTAERDLVAANERLGELADFPRLSPNPIVELDRDATVRFANDAAGHAVEGLGLSDAAGLLPADAQSIVRTALDDKQPVVDQQTRLNGRVFRWGFFPVPGRDRVYAYGSDVTVEHTYQSRLSQADKLDAVGRLASGLAHDFRNLLTGIKGYATAVIDEMDESNPFLEDLREIDRATDRATHMVRRLLTLTRDEEQDDEITCDLRREAEDLLPLLRHLLPRHAKLEFEPLLEGATVAMPRSALGRVLSNLIVNAGDALEDDGQVTIRIDSGPGDRARLIVSDTGVGMDEDTLSRIFDPFFSTKTADHGTGLGLPTVRQIVEEAGGTIHVESTVSRGTTFTIDLPPST